LAILFPGNRIAEICQERGYLKSDYDFSDIDYFEARFDTENWTSEQIEKMRRKWF